MSFQLRSGKAPLLATLVVLVVVLSGFGYYYYVTSSALSADSAKGSIKVVAWVSSSSDTTSNYQVKITNNNNFDVTLKQLTLNTFDSSGNQIGSNTIAQQIAIPAGASISTLITVSPSGGAGASVIATFSTPYGQVIVGTG